MLVYYHWRKNGKHVPYSYTARITRKLNELHLVLVDKMQLFSKKCSEELVVNVKDDIYTRYTIRRFYLKQTKTLGRKFGFFRRIWFVSSQFPIEHVIDYT